MPQMIFAARPDGHVDYFNRRWYEYTGLPNNGATGDDSWRCVHEPEGLEKVRRLWSESLRTGKPYEIEYRLRRHDGAWRWHLGRAVPIRNSDGIILRWFGTNTDIHDQKIIQEKNAFLVRLNDAVAPLTEPDTITRTAARLLGEYLHVDRCAYATVEADEDIMNLAGNYLRSIEIKSIVGRLKFSDFGQEVLAQMRANRPYVVDDIDNHYPPVKDRAAYRATQIQAVICAPLHKAGKFVSAMAVHSTTPRHWTSDEVELVLAVATRCWESIERAYVTDRLMRKSGQMEAVFQAMSEGVVVLDVSGQIVFINESQALRYGFKSSREMMCHIDEFRNTFELLGQDRKIIPFDQWPTARLLRGETFVDEELWVLRPETSGKWLIRFSGQPVCDVNGKQILGVIISRDMTAVRRSEVLIESQKCSLEMLVSGKSLAEVLSYLTNVVESQADTPAIASILLYDDEGCLRNGASPTLPEYYVRAIDGIKATPTLGTCGVAAACNRVVVTQDIDADPNWASIKQLPLGLGLCAAWSQPINATDGRVLGTFGTYFREKREPSSFERQVVEILAKTAAIAIERSRHLQALQESAERFRFMAESMPQKIFTATANGSIDYFNAQWIEFTGLELSQGADSWEQFMHPEDIEEYTKNWRHSVDTGNYFQMEHRVRRKDGMYRWHLTRVRSMRNADGKIRLWIGSSTDIDDHKTAEAQLETIVAQRTAKLQETIGELEAFSYSISHDMRAPLRAMNSFARLLAEEYANKVDDTGKDYIRRITSSATRMDQLIQDVLTYSRVSRTEWKLSPIDLDELLEGIVESYPQLHSSASTIVIEKPIPHVLGNEAGLTQCFSNLLGNAVKFVAPGARPQIRVWAELKEKKVLLYIADNGIGIPAAYQNKIFGIFQRLNAEYEGTGIGLAIVKKAVERIGGDITVSSEAGKGSTFCVELLAAP